jgi:hypothetical protein
MEEDNSKCDKSKCDFSGWATKNDIRCSDRRIIRKDAFKSCDGKVVPLVWNHGHESPDSVIGHALLENRDEGVYAYGYFNNTESGSTVKNLVLNKDINSLSIYANQLKQNGDDVIHGTIREVSLVLAGANRGAVIDQIMEHSDESGEDGYEAIIYNGDEGVITHSCEQKDDKKEEKKEATNNMAEEKKADEQSGAKEKSVKEIYDSMSPEQQAACDLMVGAALQSVEKETDQKKEDQKDMKHNAFDDVDNKEKEDDGDYSCDGETLSHSEFNAKFSEILQETEKSSKSLKKCVLEHSINNIEYLFPDAAPVNGAPVLISRSMDWVKKVMNGITHSPFSRIKSLAADITADEARAKGYVKGSEKVDEVLTALTRKTEPQTVYKHQSLDRDDIVDITDLDVVAWIKSEMRTMLDEEIARAVLVGDGRLNSDKYKIDPLKIRPIYKDDPIYSVAKILTPKATDTDDAKINAFMDSVVRSRKEYKGSGNPALYTSEDVVSGMLLLKDTTGRRIYPTMAELATALRVSEIISVPVMENVSRVDGSTTYNLLGILVNLKDYTCGADKGGSVNMFDDFDIDFNKEKYLIETRCSGALTVPYSAVVFEEKVPATEAAQG